MTFNWKEYFEGIDCQEIVRRTGVTFIILVSRNLRDLISLSSFDSRNLISDRIGKPGIQMALKKFENSSNVQLYFAKDGALHARNG